MKRLAAAAFLAIAACEPSEPALDGAPSPAPAEVDLPPGELAGGPPPGAILPGVINLVPPPNMQVVESCETIVADDYDNPPRSACLVYTDADSRGGELEPGFRDAMQAAGWTLVRSLGAEHYFERPKPGEDCADIAVVSTVTDRLQKLVDHVTATGGAADILPTHTSWYAYAVAASIHEACGADRMKP